LLFLREKDLKKVLMEGNGRENLKNGANPYYSPNYKREILARVAQNFEHCI
jgi:hypothetical protein